MKNLIIIFLTTFSILTNAQSDPNLKWLHPSPQGWQLNWIKMWDENNWYLTGQYGMFIKTTDAGQTWQTNNKAGWPNTSYPGTLTNWHANSAWFFNQNNGIVVGANTAGILKTTDGGENFDTIRVLPAGTGNLYNVFFVNSNLGFICGNSTYRIYKTTDGGTSWQQLPNLPSTNFYDVFATDESNIISCASAGNIYKTTDGGANWDIISAGTSNSLIDLECINLSTWYVAGQGGFFRYTTNAGVSWSGANVPSNFVSAKLVINSGNVYYASHQTDLYKSTNNGTTWSTINMTTPTMFSSLNYCADVFGSSIVVAGGYGNIYKSTNSGSSWNSLLQRATDASFIRSLYVENTSGKMIAVGHWNDLPGSIIYSNNGGSTWEASPFVIHYDTLLERVQMFDNNNGYFSGMYGFFAKTIDGGIHLTRINIPFAGQNILLNMDFINQSTGWVIGGLPFPQLTSIVAKTTDGGASWINQLPAGVQGVQLAIDMVDANVGYFAGSSLHKTTDGGSNWSTIPITGLVGDIRSIKAFDSNNLYVISSNGSSTGGQLFKSTNGGTNWTQIPLSINTDLFGQVWKDMNNGFLNGTLGLILVTHDGGSTWEIMNTGGWTTYGGYMVSQDTFYVTAGNGQIFRYARPSTQTTFQLSVDVNNGWNMVSIPGLNTPNQNVNTWWPGKDPAASVFKYSGGYQSITDAVPGTGYWMKNAGAQNYNTGDEWPAGGIQVVAHDPLAGAAGWNLIGGYELNASSAGVTTNPPGLQSGPIYKYSGGYQVATTIDPGYGYWMKLTGAGQIIIPETLSKAEESVKYFPEDWGRIILTDAKGISYTLFAVNGEVDLNQYELPPTPMNGMFDIRYSSGRIAEDLSKSQSIEMNSVSYPVTVKVENLNISIQDEHGYGRRIILKPGEQFTISDINIDKLNVLSGEVIAPIEYALEQNYPNPFNPSTTIKFSLPETSAVTLTIYNTLGQKVTELVNEKLEAGRYSYQWNANNIATGMYIYELRADKFVSIKKMILLK